MKLSSKPEGFSLKIALKLIGLGLYTIISFAIIVFLALFTLEYIGLL